MSLPPAPRATARRTLVIVAALAVLVPAVRMLPNVWGYAWETPERAFLGLGFLPNDFRQYASLAAQAREGGRLFLTNEYTLAPQYGRYLVLFPWIVGRISALTGAGIPPVWWAVQLATGATLLGLVWALLGRLGLGAARRLRAFVLVACSGGLEWAAWAAAGRLPAATNEAIAHITWPVIGWSTFASLFAPLGSLAYALVLAIFVLLLRAAESRSAATTALAAALVTLVYAAHGYTAVGLAGVLGATLALGLVRARRDGRDGRRAAPETGVLLVLCAAFIPPFALSLWQLQDPVFADSLGQAAAAGKGGRAWVWPLTHGLLLPLAAVGLPTLWRRDDPGARLVLGWLAGTALLAHLPFFSPSRFLFLLHLPLCVAASIGVDVLRQRGPAWMRTRPATALAAFALFATNPWVVQRSLVEVRDAPHYYLARSELAAMEAMRTLPRGGVLSGLVSGTYLPWLSRHPVYLGHWFLTPDIGGKADLMRRFFSGREETAWSERFLRDNGIRYVYRGPLERSLGRLDPALPLERVLAHAGVEVYAVTGDGRAEAAGAAVSGGSSPPSGRSPGDPSRPR